MLRQYIQLSGPIEVNLVVEAMKRGDKTFPVKHLDGKEVNIPIISLRMQTYTKGTTCVNCDREAHFFIVEKMRHDKSEKGHFNLYHRQKGGSLRMMTSDHIIAKSRGGSDVHLENRQPMCCYCNFRKSNLLPGETPPEKKKGEDNSPSKTRNTLKRFLSLMPNVKKGMPLEYFWEARAKSMARLLNKESQLTSEEQLAFRSAAMIS